MVWSWGKGGNSKVKEEGDSTGLGGVVVMSDGGGGAGDDSGWGGVGDGECKRNGVGFKVVLGSVEVVLADKPSGKGEFPGRVGSSEGWAARLERRHSGGAVW